jgi:hypothetical protein
MAPTDPYTLRTLRGIRETCCDGETVVIQAGEPSFAALSDAVTRAGGRPHAIRSLTCRRDGITVTWESGSTDHVLWDYAVDPS